MLRRAHDGALLVEREIEKFIVETLEAKLY